MFPVAALQPAFASSARFFGPALREGAREGIKCIGTVGAFYGATAAIGGLGIGIYVGGRKIAPAAGRLLRRLNPMRPAFMLIADYIDREVDRRIDAHLQAAVVHPTTVDADLT